MSNRKIKIKNIKKEKSNYIKLNFVGNFFPMVVLLILSVAFIFLCLDYKHIQDDAFITFRYAKNFVNGNGLVFNSGEHVEGFTSILWTLLLSIFIYFDADVVSVAQGSGILFGICSIWLTYFISKIYFTSLPNGENKFQSIYENLFLLLPSIMLTFTGAFLYWSISGMEVTLFISLSLLSVFLYMSFDKKQNALLWFSIIATINSIVRPEGILLFGIIIVYHWIKIFAADFRHNLKGSLKYFLRFKYLLPIIIFASVNVILMIFRLMYYGYLLPNTFYAKTGFTVEYIHSGMEYIWDFLKTYLLYGLILVLPILNYRKNKKQKYFGLFLSMIFLFGLYSIMVGGDVLPLFRFLLPILPFIYILFIYSVWDIGKTFFAEKKILNINFSYKSVILIVLALTAYNYFIPDDQIKKHAFYENQLVEKMTATSKWLQEKQIQSNKNLTVACTTIGAVSYYTDATIIDMLGLTDKIIAHNPKPLKAISGFHTGWKERNYNSDYILSRQADYIYFSTGIKPSAYAERALFLSEDFINNYYPYFFSRIPNYVETIYKRKSDPLDKGHIIKFNANPNFDSNYVNLYNEVLNIKSKPEYFNRAISLCEQIEKVRPINFLWSQYQLALLYDKIKNEDKVFELMDEAAKYDDYLSPAHFYLSKHYMKLKDYEKSKYHFDLVQKYNPEYLKYQISHK